MTTEFKRQAIRYWETRRIIYNLLLMFDVWLTWGISSSFSYHIDGGTPASLTDPMIMLSIGVILVGANICYSVVYALEFLLMSEKGLSFWPSPGRTIILVLGCLLGMYVVSQQVGYLERLHAGVPL